MTRKIYKYELCGDQGVGKPVKLVLPFGSKILTVGYQRKKFVLWCSVNPLSKREVGRAFLVAATGGEIPGDCQHIRSIEIGDEIWHVFEL